MNRFPDFVRYAVQQIKLFCPTLGKAKIAQALGVSRQTISSDIRALTRDQGALELQREIARLDRLAKADERAQMANGAHGPQAKYFATWDEDLDEAACLPRPEAEECPQVDPPIGCQARSSWPASWRDVSVHAGGGEYY